MRDKLDPLFDHLEDILAEGWGIESGGRIGLDDLQPLMETARALLMVWRGEEPLMPRGMPDAPATGPSNPTEDREND